MDKFDPQKLSRCGFFLKIAELSTSSDMTTTRSKALVSLPPTVTTLESQNFKKDSSYKSRAQVRLSGLADGWALA